jgi:hypothetical protein
MREHGTAGELNVSGRRLRVRNLDRVVFPRTETSPRRCSVVHSEAFHDSVLHALDASRACR